MLAVLVMCYRGNGQASGHGNCNVSCRGNDRSSECVTVVLVVTVVLTLLAEEEAVAIAEAVALEFSMPPNPILSVEAAIAAFRAKRRPLWCLLIAISNP